MTSSTARFRIWILLLGGGAAVLAAAFVFLPRALLGNPDVMLNHLGPTVAAAWDAGTDALSPALTDLVDYWRWWHGVKTVICALLLVVTIAASTLLWSRYVTGRSGAISAVGGTIATVLSVAVGAVLALNIQATIVPLAALFPLVPIDSDDASVSESLAELRDSLTTGQVPLGRDGISQLIERHVWHYTVVNTAVMALLAIVAAVFAIALLVRFTRSRGNRPTRVMCASVGPLLGASALGYLAVSALSMLSALDPNATAAGLLGV